MATTPSKVWTRLLGSSGSDQSTSLTTGLDGSIYVSGFTYGSLDGQSNNGGTDAFVTKYNVDGTKAWTRLLGSSADDQSLALTTGLDGTIYISGYTNGSLDGNINSGGTDAILTKYAVDGTKLWTRLLGTSGSEQGLALTTGLDGSIYVGGLTSGPLDGQTNKGSMDAFVTKYSVDGTKVWTRVLGTIGSDQALALTTGIDGSIYVGGFTGGPLDGQTISGTSDAFITKYSADGTKLWTHLLGASTYAQANALTTGLDGSIYLSGYTYSAVDGQVSSGGAEIFLAKYSADGTKVWTRLLGTSSYDQANALTTGLDGSIYVSGYTNSGLDGQSNSGSMDAFVTKYASDGTKVWTRLLGTSGYDQANALTTGLDGSIYVSGYTSGALDGQSYNGGVDAFLVKYQDLTAVPSFSISTTSLSVDEGSSAVFTLTTSNLAPGTAVGFYLSGAGITASDISTGQLSGTVAVDVTGKATISIPISSDQTTEGPETLNITVQGATASVQVIDKSVAAAPGYVLTPGSLWVNEGAVATFYLTTINVATGTVVAYTLSGAGITSADIVGGQLGGSTVIDSSGRATISIPITADGVTEGPENLVLSAGGKIVAMVVNDTGTSKTGTPGADSLVGSPGSDNIDGGAGIDTVFYGSNQSVYTITRGAGSWTVSSPAEGADILSNVERLHFADLSLALDVGLNQPSGQAAVLLGAVLPGKLALDPSKQPLMGAVIGLFDLGYSLTDLAGALLRLDIWTILTGSNSKQAIASYLLSNVNGAVPDATTLASVVSALTSEPVQGTWLAALAAGSAGQSHIGLPGLAQSGLAYIAPESISSSATDVNEGGTVSFNVTTNLPSGTSLPYTLSGTGITTGDVVGGALSGTVTVGAYGQVSVPVGIVADNLTEGPETLVFTTRGLSASVVINDTYQTPSPIVLLTPQSSSVNEGSFANFTLTTTNVAPGTVYQYTLSGTGVSANDIAGGLLTGYVSISSTGTATVAIPIAADSTTEGPETLILTVAGKTSSLVINDTSTASVAPVSSYFLSAVGSSVDEGFSATFNLTTSNVPAGTVVPYTLSGIGITNADLAGGLLNGSVIVDSAGKASISIPIAADKTTEGQELLSLNMPATTASIWINDTSLSPSSVTYQLFSSVTQVASEATVIVTLKTTGLSPGSLVPYALLKVPQSDISNALLYGNFQVGADGLATVNITNAKHANDDTMDIAVYDQHLLVTLLGVTRGG
jgi:uncharacterized protein (UPF0548 family)